MRSFIVSLAIFIAVVHLEYSVGTLEGTTTTGHGSWESQQSQVQGDHQASRGHLSRVLQQAAGPPLSANLQSLFTFPPPSSGILVATPPPPGTAQTLQATLAGNLASYPPPAASTRNSNPTLTSSGALGSGSNGGFGSLFGSSILNSLSSGSFELGPPSNQNSGQSSGATLNYNPIGRKMLEKVGKN